jgi:hypothetical protein
MQANVIEPGGIADNARPANLGRLTGRRVLCIGGLTRLVDHYRRMVEASGADFSYHDGGQEESIHRIDALVTGADAVLCQAGNVSHCAYWRLKSACKRRQLPCVFLKSAGMSSFARSLEILAEGQAR